MAFLFGLEYADELPPRVRDELEQLIAAVQVGFNGLNAQWVSVPYAASMFPANAGMTWTLPAAGVPMVRYVVSGKTMILSFYLAGATVGGVVNTTLIMMIPDGFVSAHLSYGTFHCVDNGTPGMGLIAASANSRFVQLFKSDFTNWTATAGSTTLRGTFTFEVQ